MSFISSEEVSKTGHSKREIQMPPFVMQELMEWKKFCPENELNLVFSSETGTFMDFSVKSEELENYVVLTPYNWSKAKVSFC